MQGDRRRRPLQGGQLDLGRYVRVEVDTVAVGVLKAGIALAPEGIPGRHVTASTIRRGHAVQAVNVAHSWAPERKCGARITALGWLPGGVEARDARFSIEHQTKPTTNVDFGMAMLRSFGAIGKGQADRSVEADRPFQVGNDESNRVEPRPGHSAQHTG